MTSLEVDWLDDPQNYTCYGPELPIAEARSSLVLTKRENRKRGVNSGRYASKVSTEKT